MRYGNHQFSLGYYGRTARRDGQTRSPNRAAQIHHARCRSGRCRRVSPFAAWTDKPIYIVWRGSDKSPIDPLHAEPASEFANLDAQKPANWLPYDVAAEYARALGPGYGVGVVISAGCGLLCVDIDGCVIDGKLSEFAVRMVTEARTHCPGVYVELSMSGRGVHIIGPYSGEPPAHSTKNKELHCELYTSRRYIALTGVPCPAI